jgi:hypothetical protein
MTTRQRNLGVTAYGIEQVKKGNYMADYDSFKAWMSTVKKGEYIGRNLLQKMYDELSKIVGFEATFTESDFFRFQCMCRGLAANHPQYFYYTDTLGLDNLTIR